MRKQPGFTLIELMIVVVVIAILAAVAIPSYSAYVRRGERSAAQQLMLAISSREEQHLLDARQYTATVGTNGLGYNPQGWTCAAAPAATCVNARYTLTVTVDNAATPPTFSICGIPAGSQAGDGGLLYTNVGTKQRRSVDACTGGTDLGW